LRPGEGFQIDWPVSLSGTTLCDEHYGAVDSLHSGKLSIDEFDKCWQLLSPFLTSDEQDELSAIRAKISNNIQQQQVEAEQQKAVLQQTEQIIVTTTNLDRPYTVVGPIYVQVNNRGLFANAFNDLVNRYQSQIDALQQRGILSNYANYGAVVGEGALGQGQFEKAFFVATQVLKKRAYLLGANAVIGMHQDIDIDTKGIANFYMQMYGTAVRLS
jgi:hypothetical protein